MIKKLFTYKNIIFFIVAILFMLAIPKIMNILLLFFAAYVFACALDPFVEKLSKKMNRTMAIIIVIVMSFLLIQALFIPIFVVGAKEVALLISSAPEKLDSISHFLSTAHPFGLKLSEFIRLNNIDISSLLNKSPAMAKHVIDQSVVITTNIFQFLVIGLALTMILFYMLSDKEYLKDKFLALIPPDLKGKAMNIVESISGKVGGYVRGQLLSMLAIGIMVSVVLLLFGVHYATLLGLLSGLLDIVPVVGPTIALICIISAAIHLGIIKIVLIAALFLLIQQLSNCLVRPFLFGKLMSLHPLTIFLALFLADQFIGFWGVLLSPAIAATICVLIDELYIAPLNKGSVIGKTE